MDFDFKKYNANIDRLQSYKPGTRQWDKRLEEESYQERLRTPSFKYDDILKKKDEEEKEKEEEGCFITTACIISRGLDDNCEELKIMRKYRDEYIRKNLNGRSEISRYYALAPKIVISINNNKLSKEIYKSIYEKMTSAEKEVATLLKEIGSIAFSSFCIDLASICQTIFALSKHVLFSM